MRIDEIRTADDLLQFIENWTSWNGDPHAYDSAGIMQILDACLKHLSRFSIDADFEEIQDYFDAGQVDILRKLLNGAVSK